MTTSTSRIARDTSSSSDFNDEAVRKSLIDADRKIFVYLNNFKCHFRGKSALEFESNLESYGRLSNPNIFPAEDDDAKRPVTYFIDSNGILSILTSWLSEFGDADASLRKAMHTLSIPPVEDYPTADAIKELYESMYSEILNIEGEEYDAFERGISEDYGVEGVSVECRKAEARHERLMALRRQHGITD